MAIILEMDVFDAEAYDTNGGITSGELVLTLNGTKLTDFPYGYLNLVTPGSLPPCSVNPCAASGWGGVWRHPSLDISARIVQGPNTLVLSEINGHSSGYANITIKDSVSGQTLAGPFQANPNLSSLVGAPGTVGGCTASNCYVFNSGQIATYNFNIALLNVDFTATPTAPDVGQTVNFAAAASGGTPPYTYAWNFGDGGTGSGGTAAHVFAVGGTYNVTLTVHDSGGLVGIAQHSITVSGVHSLTITSTPSPIPFQINGSQTNTPFSQSLSAVSYTIVMPSSIVIGGITFTFSSWSDGTLGATRIVNLTQDTSLSALYTGQGLSHTLTVSSNPSGIGFQINAQGQTTPYTQQLPEAIYTITMPQTYVISGVTYTFQSWSNGSTQTTQVVSLLTDITLSANFTGQAQNPTLAISSVPSGVIFQLNGASQTTPYTQSLAQASYIIAMPGSVTVGGVTYTFQSWNDGVTTATRTLVLSANTSLIATYTGPGGGGGTDPLVLALVIGGVAVAGGVGIYLVAKPKKGGGGKAKPSVGPR